MGFFLFAEIALDVIVLSYEVVVVQRVREDCLVVVDFMCIYIELGQRRLREDSQSNAKREGSQSRDLPT